MVARINTSKNISKALNYNEQKVKEGKAEALAALGFVKELNQLNFYDKLSHFERLIELNERTVTNTLHVSLNFDPSEKLRNEKLIEIADSYMQNIGFGDQPYLVYKHDDAGHPHIHIVSTNITKEGSRISMHNLGRNQSEKARREIEKDFGLVKADSKKGTAMSKLVPVQVQKINYGKSETKRAISNVLQLVLNQYKYSSIHELNAVLQLYQVRAEGGTENSRLFLNRGLVYRVLNEQGEKVGAPIKASAFYMKPTLAFLEKKFSTNQPLKDPYKKRIQTTIQWVLLKEPTNLVAFIKALEKENISVVLRKGKAEVIYGITYVDHSSKTVFNGSDLGKAFSAKTILEKTAPGYINGRQKDIVQAIQTNPGEGKEKTYCPGSTDEGILAEVLSPSPGYDYIPHQLKKKKKKKKKQLSL